MSELPSYSPRALPRGVSWSVRPHLQICQFPSFIQVHFATQRKIICQLLHNAIFFHTFYSASHFGLTYIFGTHFISCLLQHSFCSDTQLNISRHKSASARPELHFRECLGRMHRGTSLIRNRSPLRPYRRPMPTVPWWPLGDGGFL